ncbi:AEC family transporter, partial [Limosilactobacillus reuteri]|uniref:AEC family transporter n=1 Tax=Limosilactobacillus reuteri TaxID=1598 RepID=UPI003857A457
IFLLMLLGAVIKKLGFLHPQSINDLTNITLYFLSPIVIIKAFKQPISRSRFYQLLLLITGVFLTYFVSILITNILFHKEKEIINRRISLS